MELLVVRNGPTWPTHLPPPKKKKFLPKNLSYLPKKKTFFHSQRKISYTFEKKILCLSEKNENNENFSNENNLL